MTVTFILIGLAAGVLAGLFGIGGGILIIPLLVFVAKFSQHAAHGTSLGALLLPVGALGAYEYWRHGNVNVRAAALLALGLFLGAWFGARLATQLTPLVLRRTFAAFLVIVAVRLWVKG